MTCAFEHSGVDRGERDEEGESYAHFPTSFSVEVTHFVDMDVEVLAEGWICSSSVWKFL